MFQKRQIKLSTNLKFAFFKVVDTNFLKLNIFVYKKKKRKAFWKDVLEIYFKQFFPED